MNRCIIIGGAEINNLPRVKSYIRPTNFIIACDSGINNCKKLGLIPSLIIGDFDSCAKPGTNIKIIELPKEKDDTDTMFAVKEAVKRGFEEIILIGAVGGRLDHTLVNVYSLLYIEEAGIKGLVVDDYSEISIVNKEAKVAEDCDYFSIVAIDGTATGVTIKNAKFELADGEITPDYQYATSNEVIEGKTAKVTVESGKLLLIKDFLNDEF